MADMGIGAVERKNLINRSKSSQGSKLKKTSQILRNRCNLEFWLKKIQLKTGVTEQKSLIYASVVT